MTGLGLLSNATSTTRHSDVREVRIFTTYREIWLGRYIHGDRLLGMRWTTVKLTSKRSALLRTYFPLTSRYTNYTTLYK
jgi:hypothetical protein